MINPVRFGAYRGRSGQQVVHTDVDVLDGEVSETQRPEAGVGNDDHPAVGERGRPARCVRRRIDAQPGCRRRSEG